MARICPFLSSDFRGGLSNFDEHPLERPDPPAAFVPSNREYAELRRAPLEELTSELLKPLANRLLVSHVTRCDDWRVVSPGGEEDESYRASQLRDAGPRSGGRNL